MGFDAADFACFLDPDMPGYVLASHNGQPLPGLFRAEYAESFGLIGGNRPALRVMASASVALGDAMTIGLEAYTVAEIKPDGRGMQLLMLEST